MSAISRAAGTDLATWTARQTVRPEPAVQKTSGSADATRASGKAKDVAQQFEAIYLRQMLDAALPKDSESLFGEGTSGTMWRSMFADTLATTLSKSGTVGIANMILKSETNQLKGK